MSQYKYGMYVKDIAKIKKEIKSGLSDDDIIKKWNITEGQIGFIHDVLLKGSFRNIERRVTNLEMKKDKRIPVKGSLVFCNHIGYGVGEVISIHSHGLMLVKFQDNDLKVMCNRKQMITVHDDTKRRLRLMAD